MKIITPIVLVLNSLFEKIKEFYPGVTFQFDPSLTYVEAIRGLRAIRSAMELDTTDVFPLLTWSRGTLVRQDEKQARLHFPANKRVGDGEADQFKFRNCKFEFLFKFYDTDTVMNDSFEVRYCTDDSFNNVRSFSVNLPEVGDFNYQVMWDDLSEIEYSKDDNNYIAVAGSATIMGPFMIMTDAPAALIEQINLSVREFNNNVLSDTTIPETVSLYYNLLTEAEEYIMTEATDYIVVTF